MDEFDKNMNANKEKLQNGPIANRSSTDKLCCLIFLVAIVAFVGASYYGWTNGNPEELIIGWDSDARGCGYSEETKDYPFVYWPEPPSADVKAAAEKLDYTAALSSLKLSVCVKECPKKGDPVQCLPTTHIIDNDNYSPDKECVYQIDANFLESWGVDVKEYAS